jgi:hypothetical protein
MLFDLLEALPHGLIQKMRNIFGAGFEARRFKIHLEHAFFASLIYGMVPIKKSELLLRSRATT